MVNDISIIAGITSVFVLLGVFLPYINAEYGEPDSFPDPDVLEQNVGEEQTTVGSVVSGWKVLGSVLSMFFWTFGALPFWLDALFVIARVTLALTVVRNIWIGGGG
jgi:hypothetical protein